MSTFENKSLICIACGQAEANGWNIEAGRCRACNALVPVPLVFASVDEDPESAGANACGEACLWLVNHGITRDAIVATHTNVTVGGPLDQYPFSYTLTYIVEVPRYLIEDHTGDALPVQTVESVREMADALSRPRTTPPTTNRPAGLPLN